MNLIKNQNNNNKYLIDYTAQNNISTELQKEHELKSKPHHKTAQKINGMRS